ncbi:hypothetical protein OIO90_001739 [Microbotryomycetes sp. JL221]|nr:hypothetical protein OIO90_001739 [Microbotryomycetes sp. JL221]
MSTATINTARDQRPRQDGLAGARDDNEVGGATAIADAWIANLRQADTSQRRGDMGRRNRDVSSDSRRGERTGSRVEPAAPGSPSRVSQGTASHSTHQATGIKPHHATRQLPPYLNARSGDGEPGNRRGPRPPGPPPPQMGAARGPGRHQQQMSRVYAERRYDADFDRSGTGPSRAADVSHSRPPRTRSLFDPFASTPAPNAAASSSTQQQPHSQASKGISRSAATAEEATTATRKPQRSQREPVNLMDLGRRATANKSGVLAEHESRESIESEESVATSGGRGSRSSRDGLRPRRSRKEESRAKQQLQHQQDGQQGALPSAALLTGGLGHASGANSKQLFDPRKDDPVRFTATGSTTSLNRRDGLRIGDTVGSTVSLVSQLSLADSTTSQAIERAPSTSTASRTQQHPLVAQLKDVYRLITRLESHLQEEHRLAIMATNREEDDDHVRIKGGGKKFDDEYWVKLATEHKELADLHYSFMQMALEPHLPASLQALPQKYNIPSRMWQTAFHQLLERMRYAVIAPQSSESHVHPDTCPPSSVLEHMIEFIQHGYGHYSQLFEDPTVGTFRAAWIEQLGDLARYRMAVAGLSARISAARHHQQMEKMTEQAIDMMQQDSSREGEIRRPADQASIGVAALDDWDVEEQDSWRTIAIDWYNQGVSESPGTGRLQHHLALLSKGDELKTLYHFAKGLTTSHPYSNGRESILPLFEDEHQARRTRSDVSKAELFVHLHGMLFTKIALDDFEEVLARFIEKLKEEGLLLAKSDGAWAQTPMASQPPFDDAEWSMMAVINIAAVMQYGAEDSVLGDLIVKQRSNGGQSVGSKASQQFKQVMQKVPQAIMVHSASVGRESAEDRQTEVQQPHLSGSPPSNGPDVVMSLNPTSEDDPLAFCLARRLMFDMLSLALTFPARRVDRCDVTNPYITIVATFLGCLSEYNTALRRIESSVPWTQLIEYLNLVQQPDLKVEGVGSKLTGPPLPEDWCIRGMSWTGRHLYSRNFWHESTEPPQAEDTNQPRRFVGSESEALSFRLSNLEQAIAGAADNVLAQPSTSVASSLEQTRRKRLLTVTAWLARNVAGIDFEIFDNKTKAGRLVVGGALQAKIHRWRKAEEEAAAAARMSLLSTASRPAPSNELDESDDDAMSEDDDANEADDDNDSPALKELKARRRHLKAVIRQAHQATRGASQTSIRRVTSSGSKTYKTQSTLKLVPSYTVLMFDTNIILSSLPLLQDLVESGSWTIIVPLAVITELDGLKRNSTHLGSAAQEAILYLETAIRTHSRVLKVQTSRGNYLHDLTIRSESIDFAAGGGVNGDRSHEMARSMDDVILRAVAWQQEHFTNRLLMLNPHANRSAVNSDACKVVLITFDRNLRLKARARGLAAADEAEMVALIPQKTGTADAMNHPRSSPRRTPLPWRNGQTLNPSNLVQPISCLIVTPELASLHKNGGIGTAFTELAYTLGVRDDMRVTVLMVQEESSFPAEVVANAKVQLLSKNVELVFLETSGEIMPHMWTPVTSVRVWKWLRARDGVYNFIHFPDNTGIGYFTALGKHEGLALQDSLIVVGLHGPDVEWSSMLDKRLPSDRYSVELEHFEKWSVELADVAVAPSDYILEYVRMRGWITPEHSFVIPNIFDAGVVDKHQANILKSTRPVTELVFFGRLEERKGPRLMVRALETIFVNSSLAANVEIQGVTFLGRDHTDQSTHSDVSSLITQAIDELRTQTGATFDLNIVRDANRDTAIKYLQDPSRLVIMPALADNSPNTVLECMAHSIRFVTSNTGGSPELIHPDDVDRATCAPIASALASTILSRIEHLKTEPWQPIKPHPAVLDAAEDWVSLHLWLVSMQSRTSKRQSFFSGSPTVTLCITHFERSELLPQLLMSIEQQTYDKIDVVLIDDGSTTVETLGALDTIEDKFFASRANWQLVRSNNSYLGEARNKAASRATGEWLLFLDDDDVLKPHAVETLVHVAKRTGVHALSSFLDEFSSDVNPLERNEALPHRRTFWFLGQSLSAGLVSNCFGSGNVFVQRRVFDSIGGFSTYRDVGAEDWEIYMRLATAGWQQLVVPDEIIYVRSDMTRNSMKFSMDAWDSSYRALVPLLNDDRVQSLGLATALMLAKTAIDRPDAARMLADSVEDFQLIQGWAGWSYHFERIETGPRLQPERQAVAFDGNWFFERDGNSGSITSEAQSPHVSNKGVKFAAVRAYTAPRRMTVAAEFSFSASHNCGDGAQVVLMHRDLPVDDWAVLGNWSSTTQWFAETRYELELKKGSQIVIWVDPLETVECDSVNLRLSLISVPSITRAWSTLRPAVTDQEADSEEAGSTPGLEDDGDDGDDNAQNDRPDDDSKRLSPYDYHLALIFDRGRRPHAMAVIRSAIQFVTSRKLVFHLVAPRDMHDELLETFEGFSARVVLYDHARCHELARPVLAFSNPDIHVSAHCKMFLSSIIDDPAVESVMYLDSDVTVLSDISQCYDEPALPTTLISMAPDLGDACQVQPDLCWPIGMHWRLPQGLKCGTVPSKAQQRDSSQFCARPGDLETFQVNGGVALFQLGRMRDTNFVKRYIQSIIHHYRVVGRVAEWGEQDFINSFFRLYPRDIELLPCGCNYQWFASRREAICGEQPIYIAHHWSFGIATRTKNPFNAAFFHFLDDGRTQDIPLVPTLSPSLPGAPNSSNLEIERTLNCPRQSHTCETEYRPSQHYGSPVSLISRFHLGQFQSDLVFNIESQVYPTIRHLAAAPANLALSPTNLQREEVNIDGDIVVARLMSHVDNERDLIVFRVNTTGPEADFVDHKKVFEPSELQGLGFMFHSSNIEATHWLGQRCDIWRTYNNLSQLLKIRWVNLVPMVEHPLQRHLPETTATNFGLTVVVLETEGRPTWTSRLVDMLKSRSFNALVKHVLVATTGSLSLEHESAQRIRIEPGKGLSSLSNHIGTEGVLLISDSIVLDRPALNALVTFWLDDPVRIVGLFTETALDDFSAPLSPEGTDFFYEQDPDPLVGVDRFPYLLPRTLLTHRAHLDELKSILEGQYQKRASNVLHPRCHPLLLSALASRLGGGQVSPLRVIPPPSSITDRVDDCRSSNWADVELPSAVPGDYRDGDPQIPRRPSFGECVAEVDQLMGGTGETKLRNVKWITYGDKVGVSGSHGYKVGIESARSIDPQRWKNTRRSGHCFKQ